MSENYAHEERTRDLISILTTLKNAAALTDLTELDTFENDPMQHYIAELDAIYYADAVNDNDGNAIPYRHSYSDISNQLYIWSRANEKYDAEVLTILMDNISAILERIGRNHRLSKPLTKLYDHICLESVRIAQLEAVFVQLQAHQNTQDQLNDLLSRAAKVQQSFDEYDIQAKNVQEDIDKKNSSLQKLRDDVTDVHTQSISVLSIFAAMAFIFTGGFTMLSGVFTALQTIDKHKAMLLASVLVFIGTVIIDAIWILIRAARKYMQGGDKLPTNFIVFTGLMCAVAIILFILYLWDPWGFMNVTTAM